MTIVVSSPDPGPIGVGYLVDLTSSLASVGDVAEVIVTKPGSPFKATIQGNSVFQFTPNNAVYLGMNRIGDLFNSVRLGNYGQDLGTPVDVVVNIYNISGVVETLTITGTYTHDPVTNLYAWIELGSEANSNLLPLIYRAVHHDF